MKPPHSLESQMTAAFGHLFGVIRVAGFWFVTRFRVRVTLLRMGTMLVGILKFGFCHLELVFL